MFAKRFFNVSAAILCLALAYHLVARNAGAQSGMGVTAVGFSGPGVWGTVWTCTVGRTAYVSYSHGGVPYVVPQPVPGTANPVATHFGAIPGGDGVYVVLENGDIWGASDVLPRAYMGNLVALGATPVMQQTMGQLKVRYR